MSLVDIRDDYNFDDLRAEDLDPDPLRQLSAWVDLAIAARVREPNAMTLATADAEGRPSARIVLLRGIDDRGLMFFTNYRSRKGCELEARPRAAIVLFWAELERQARIEGSIEHVSAAGSDEYFASRPRFSQLAAWASDQSETIASRDVLEERMKELVARFEGGPVPRPPHWGGYRLVPDRVELWQGRPSRLHDRFCYRRGEGPSWQIVRLSP